MLSVNEAIIVEGKYDKIKLSGLVDATVISTDGFAIFKDDKKIGLLRRLAQERGVIIFTDSDRAGFVIRNYISQCLCNENVKHAYLPEIKGTESRKRSPSKEGLLGVEGVSDNMIVKALQDANPSRPKQRDKNITKADLYADGLLGREGSSKIRRKVLASMGLPTRLSTNALLKIINALYTYEQYKKIISLFKN